MSYNDSAWQDGIQLLEFRGDKVVRERIYVMERWEAPAWRAPWREQTRRSVGLRWADWYTALLQDNDP